MIVQWILDSWKELDEEIIVKSFKARALNLNVDGSKDKSIYCLIKDLPCQEGYNQLQTHLRILDDHIICQPVLKYSDMRLRYEKHQSRCMNF